MYAERPDEDTRHQWVLMLTFELSSHQAKVAQAELDQGNLPDPIALNGSILDVPPVFCWRCLQPFGEHNPRTPCLGDEGRHARGGPASTPRRPRVKRP